MRWSFVALAPVAGAAGGDAVHPAVEAAARHRRDVLARQLVEVEAPTAVGADLAVAIEQLRVAQRRNLAPGTRRDRAAHRDDRVQFDARLQAADALDAAAQHVEGVAERPRHRIAGIQHGRFARRDPGLRTTRHVELKDVHGGEQPPTNAASGATLRGRSNRGIGRSLRPDWLGRPT